MKKGTDRFSFYLQKINLLMSKAIEQKDPAMWLFTNQARTPFFMLESLARLYSKIYSSKEIGKLYEHFKLIEDSLGQIDYYYSLSLAFAGNTKIPAEYKRYFKEQIEQISLATNELLVEKGWLSDNDKRLGKITNKLKKVDWLNSEKEVEAIGNFYKTSIDSIGKFATKTGYSFDNVEEDIHELRRKLRWLSIYPQALQGVIQYAPETKAADTIGKYLTKEIKNSPFNKLPAAGNNTYFLLLNKNYFLSLSWLIAELGTLKDEGLLLAGLTEAIEKSSGCDTEESLTRAYKLLGNKQRQMQEILAEASSLTKTYFEEGNLQHLIAGISRPV